MPFVSGLVQWELPNLDAGHAVPTNPLQIQCRFWTGRVQGPELRILAVIGPRLDRPSKSLVDRDPVNVRERLASVGS